MTIINLSRISIRRQNLYRTLITNNPNKPRIASRPINHNLINLPIPDVIRLAGLEPEPFGSTGEKILTHHMNLLPRLNQKHDARTPDGRRVEIKCARYQIRYTKELNYCWTRINLLPDAGYDLLLLALLTEWGFKTHVLDQQQIQNLAQLIRQTRKLGNSHRMTIWRDDLLFFLINSKNLSSKCLL